MLFDQLLKIIIWLLINYRDQTPPSTPQHVIAAAQWDEQDQRVLDSLENCRIPPVPLLRKWNLIERYYHWILNRIFVLRGDGFWILIEKGEDYLLQGGSWGILELLSVNCQVYIIIWKLYVFGNWLGVVDEWMWFIIL